MVVTPLVTSNSGGRMLTAMSSIYLGLRDTHAHTSCWAGRQAGRQAEKLWKSKAKHCCGVNNAVEG